MNRIFDIVFSSALGIAFLVPFIIITILIKLTSKGPILYWSRRIGKNNREFLMPKFRSMRIDTPVVATHLLKDANSFLTPIGNFLRKSSLDELPQLYCIITGDMSFVGPRPALYNQYDLIDLRANKKVHTLVPGITGWAQINGRDELSIEEKVKFDKEYLDRKSLMFNFHILFLTMLKVVRKDGIQH
jgi:O-antigen biosynthesis protein WbqP